MEYAIETFSLTKIFSDWWGRNKVCAVDELSLQIRDNEVFGLLGPNGSGKTTTLKLLLGLLHPTGGKSIILGGDGTDPKISRRIGFMPEESYLYRYLNARETLDFYGRLFGLATKVRKMRIEALLDMVGLKAVANRPVGTYSKGMARRIGLAQALINDPDLLILDEPTTGLDPMGTRQIKDLMLELAKRGKTILLCSHLLADVEDVCDRIAILYGGKVQSEGQVRQLLQRTDKRQITTGSISDKAMVKIKRIVEDEQADFEVTTPMEKLETFFIKTVVEARQQGLATSGVVSDGTSRISDFLVSKATGENILEKLVSGPLPQEPLGATSQKESSAAVEDFESKPDEQLLSSLTGQSGSEETNPVVRDESIEKKATESVTEEDGQVRKDILDELSYPSEGQPADAGERQKDNSEGDCDDA